MLFSRTSKPAHKQCALFKDSTFLARKWYVLFIMARSLAHGTQRIAYAKRPSDVIARLRGTYVPPQETAGPVAGASTDLQKSIFSGPPRPELPSKPPEDANGVPVPQATHGVKRPREEEASDEEEAPMDEESDVPMEASSDED